MQHFGYSNIPDSSGAAPPQCRKAEVLKDKEGQGILRGIFKAFKSD